MDYTQGHRIQSQELISDIYNSTNCFKQAWHHAPRYLPEELHTVRLWNSPSVREQVNVVGVIVSQNNSTLPI